MRRRFASGSLVGFILAVLLCGSCGHVLDDGSKRGLVHLNRTDAGVYQLIRNGEPFQVRGGSGNSHLGVLRDYGGNTIRVYDTTRLATILDEAERYGLAVIADIPVPPYHKQGGDEAAQIRRTRDELLATVATYRDHPALLFWMLGNELFQDGFDGDYVDAYNDLAAGLRALDTEHPISTTVISNQMVDIHLSWELPDVDFYSFNVFGNVGNLDRVRNLLALRWSGPYLISEWSYNGPWESQNTSWNAPIESPSSKKAEQLEARYREHVGDKSNERLLGSMAFYWGNKYERTPTWFSLFGNDGEISPMAFSLQNCWKDREEDFPGPQIEYLLLGGKGAADDIILDAGQRVNVTVQYREPPGADYRVSWEVRREDWQHEGENGVGPESIPDLIESSTLDGATFRVPPAEGPYRVYCSISDSSGYFAAANVPFYTLSTSDAK